MQSIHQRWIKQFVIFYWAVKLFFFFEKLKRFASLAKIIDVISAHQSDKGDKNSTEAKKNILILIIKPEQAILYKPLMFLFSYCLVHIVLMI